MAEISNHKIVSHNTQYMIIKYKPHKRFKLSPFDKVKMDIVTKILTYQRRAKII